jgi:hypothetical protein
MVAGIFATNAVEKSAMPTEIYFWSAGYYFIAVSSPEFIILTCTANPNHTASLSGHILYYLPEGSPQYQKLYSIF